jgi:competence protein ComEA
MELNQKEKFVFVVLILGLVSGLAASSYRYVRWSKKNYSADISKIKIVKDSKIKPEKNKEIKVYITGAVWNSQVYSVCEGARLEEVINKAIPKADADLNSINLAMLLKDEQRIFIPTKKEGENNKILVKESAERAEDSSDQTVKININSGSQEELEKLPSIGPKRARAIIKYREKAGLFESIEEIKSVKGIGEKIFEKIKNKIYIE